MSWCATGKRIAARSDGLRTERAAIHLLEQYKVMPKSLRDPECCSVRKHDRCQWGLSSGFPGQLDPRQSSAAVQKRAS